MSQVKISQLPELTKISANDLFVVVDSLTNITKKITWANLSIVTGPSSSVNNQIAKFSGTTGKIITASNGPIIGNNGVLILRTSNNDTPFQLNNSISSGLNAPVANEINFKPNESPMVYGYGVISWYCEDYNTKDVILQAHRALDSDSDNIHKHFSFYSSNAARDTTIKRYNIQYGVDNALMDFQNTYLTIDTFGNNIGLLITSTGASAQTVKFTNSSVSSAGAILGLTNSGGGPLISGTSASTTNAAIDIISEFGYRHQMNRSGGYGLNLFTDATHTVSSTFGLARIANLTAADTNPTLILDNRSAGNSLLLKNDTTEYLNISNIGVITLGTDTNLYRASANTLKTDGNLVMGGNTDYSNLAVGAEIIKAVADAIDPTSGGGAASGRIAVNIGGATKYLAYY
jgi:hypothetical protein